MIQEGNPNRDHRERLKKRFAERGLDEFWEHQALELLLFYAVPRRDVNPLAHHLLARFDGSLDRVINAPAEALADVRGVGAHTAALLGLVSELIPRYARSRAAPGVTADTPERAARALEDYFFAATEDGLYTLFLDGAQRVTACRYVGESLAGQNARALAQSAAHEGAAGVILGWNRSGEPAFTACEETAARRMKQALARIGIEFQDVVLFAGGEAVSASRMGLL
ncbi:MAG: hypothetical protein FWG93_05255 [Oscillospiraceae bacterium]|nr:hypothetical protein [Oscillospiraceae bacterium]